MSEETARAEHARKKMAATMHLGAAARMGEIAASQAEQLSTLFETSEDVLEEIGNTSAHVKRQEMLARLKAAWDLYYQAMQSALDAAKVALGD